MEVGEELRASLRENLHQCGLRGTRHRLQFFQGTLVDVNRQIFRNPEAEGNETAFQCSPIKIPSGTLGTL